jgi:hypothetical protein
MCASSSVNTTKILLTFGKNCQNFDIAKFKKKTLVVSRAKATWKGLKSVTSSYFRQPR